MKYFLLFVSIAWALLIYRLTTTPQIVVTKDSIIQMLLMMGAHFVFFGIQAVFVYLQTLDKKYSILVASLYGLLIEVIQLRVPGRSADIVDWSLDTLGAFVFIWFVRKYTRQLTKVKFIKQLGL